MTNKTKATKTIPFGRLSAEWKKDPAFRAEYERLGPVMELAFRLAEFRHKTGLTQAEVAKRMKTTQSAIARLESGKVDPGLKTLAAYAEAVGARLKVDLVAG